MSPKPELKIEWRPQQTFLKKVLPTMTIKSKSSIWKKNKTIESYQAQENIVLINFKMKKKHHHQQSCTYQSQSNYPFQINVIWDSKVQMFICSQHSHNEDLEVLAYFNIF